ncbi:MAG: hypothetical protein E6300_16875 [Clostridium sp.]|uniref:hypothetical protein n=2 Tax=Clostridium sp. TaxID=1506 RepID=UPI002910C7C5|nr:hypothetical protein [Clostridium sp.]MDU7150151.1 hypothetical protein [Clostridium sp.]
MGQIKIKELLVRIMKAWIEDREITEKKYKEKEITMDNNYLFEIYSIYKEKNIEDIIKNLIKVNLPNDKEEAKELLLNGFKYKGVEYVSLITTVGAMKHENMELETKCDYFFINKEDKDFINELENIASLGKLKTLEGEVICINKDIVSRLSLLLSSGKFIYFDKPLKYAVLPEMTFTYINNYLQFAEKIVMDEERKEIKVIDQDNLRLEKYPNLEVKHIAMDGSGFMMPSIADEITKQLKVDYDINWVGFRMLGNASKGLLVKFDWKEYLKEEKGLDNLIIKDMWNNDVDLFEVDLVFNESLVKWGKLFNSYEEMINLKDGYSKYLKLFDSLCITKFNKNEPKEYSLSNYQILSNLALNYTDIYELASEDIEVYTSLLYKNQDKDRMIDTLRIMLGDWAKNDEELEGLDLTPYTKIHQALQLDKDMTKVRNCKYLIDKMINKKINLMAGGRFHIKGNYKVVIKDVFSYFDSLINAEYVVDGIKGQISKNGLKAETNYVPNEEGKRVLARCPLNSATEILKTTLVKNKMYDKYFGNFSKDIIFYAFDDFMMRQSGEDEDTDISLVIDNEEIYNSVIEDIDKNGTRWCFRNQFDGKADKRKYTKANMYKCILETAGNSIGMLSNFGAKISNLIGAIAIKNEYGELTSKIEVLKKHKERHKAEYDKAKNEKDESKRKLLYQELNEGFDRFIKNNYLEVSQEEQKVFTLKQFQDYKQYSYYTLYLQMVAIDSVKTNIKVGRNMLKPLNEIGIKFIKKPIYIYHSKYKEINKTVNYKDVRYTDTTLNLFCKTIVSELGFRAREKDLERAKNDHIYTVMRSVKKQGYTSNNNLEKELSKIYKDYLIDADLIKEQVKELKAEKNNIKDGKDLETINIKIAEAEEDRNEKLTQLSVTVNKKIDKEIRSRYKCEEILLFLAEYRDDLGHRVKPYFIFEFFFEEFKNVLIERAKGVIDVYVLDEKGEVHYLYKNYKKVPKNYKDINLSKAENLKKAQKLGEIKKIRMNDLTYIEVEEGFTVTKKSNYIFIKKKDSDNFERLGTLFDEYLNIEDDDYKVVDVEIPKNKKYTEAKSLGLYIEV